MKRSLIWLMILTLLMQLVPVAHAAGMSVTLDCTCEDAVIQVGSKLTFTLKGQGTALTRLMIVPPDSIPVLRDGPLVEYIPVSEGKYAFVAYGFSHEDASAPGYAMCYTGTMELIVKGTKDLGKEQMNGPLTAPVRCFAVDANCAYFSDPAGPALGVIPGNAPVTVSAIRDGYATVTFAGCPDSVLVSTDRLSLLPLRRPQDFGWHKDLYLDGWHLSRMTSEAHLYEYYQDVQLWSDYLYELAAYRNAHLDIETLRSTLLVEIYMRYDEALEVVPGMDLLFDVESMMEFDFIGMAEHVYFSADKQMPSLKSMQAFVTVLGNEGKTYAHEQLAEFIDLYENVRDLGKDVKGSFTAEELKKIDDFFEKVDDLPVIDDIGDVLEDIFEGLEDTKLGELVKKVFKKAGPIADESLELLGDLLPYLEIAVAFAELKVTLENLTDVQEAMLRRLSESEQGTYSQFVAEALLNYDRWYQYYVHAINSSINEALAEAAGKYVPYLAVINASTTAAALWLQFDGTADRATSAMDQLLRSCMAQELLINGAALEASQFLYNLEGQPTQADLVWLETLMAEYLRLYGIVREEYGQHSDFAELARKEIDRCREYAGAPAIEPEKPLLFQYQPVY